MTGRCILHVDMDAFYASVEQRDDASLRGKPLVVGGGENRGVVAAASYEARKFGIRSAMPMAEANRRCPNLLRVAPRMAQYKLESEKIFTVFREFTPAVEGLSLDEAFLDVTGSLKLFGSGENIAREIKARIRDRTGLAASVGVAENKLVAKIASDLEKPDGLVVISAANCRHVLDPLPVSVIPGIGKQTLRRLHAIDVRTVRDLRVAEERRLAPIFGRYTDRTRARAAGIDDRPVNSSRADKSISAEETYDQDLSDPALMERELLRLTERTSRRLQKASLAAGTVHVKIRQANFSTFTRQSALSPPGNATDALFLVARKLLSDWLLDNPGIRVRLLGVGGSKLVSANQPDLFSGFGSEEKKPVDFAVNDIRDRFGDAAVSRARTLRSAPTPGNDRPAQKSGRRK